MKVLVLTVLLCVGSVYCDLTCGSSLKMKSTKAGGNGCASASGLHWEQDDSSSQSIQVTGITASYNGKPADSQGGLDLSQNLVLSIVANNKYGVITTPLLDVQVSHCNKKWGGKNCGFHTGALSLLNAALQNLDPCDASLGVSVTPDCHLAAASNGQTINLNVNLSTNTQIYGLINQFISHNTDYKLTITMREAAEGKAQTLAVVAAADRIK